MKRFSPYNFINIIFPAIAMIIIGYVSFTDVFIQQTDHKYFILSILIIYPVLFLIQGGITALLKGNILISLAVSILGFVVTMFAWLNSSAAGYILLYLLFGLLGYGVVGLIKKGKRAY